MLKQLCKLVFVRPHADQLRLAAVVADSSFLAAIASKTNCWFALTAAGCADSQVQWFSGLNDLQLREFC
eukprot:scaffold170152_cov12-Tisochrysis_lutea.AAC.1